MFITRRTLMVGLAVLSAFRIPGLAAKQEPDFPEDDFDDAPIQYLEVGECPEMLGGPATEPGWFLHPECMIGCCPSLGPLPTKEAAIEADRLRWERITEGLRKRRKEKREKEEILPF